MQLKKALEDKNLDVRLRDRLLAEGKLAKKDLDKNLKDLSDDKDKLVESKVELKSN